MWMRPSAKSSCNGTSSLGNSTSIGWLPASVAEVSSQWLAPSWLASTVKPVDSAGDTDVWLSTAWLAGVGVDGAQAVNSASGRVNRAGRNTTTSNNPSEWGAGRPQTQLPAGSSSSRPIPSAIRYQAKPLKLWFLM